MAKGNQSAAAVLDLVRRSSPVAESTSLSLDLLSRKVTRAGEELELHAREFSLLEYLLRNRGRVVTRTMIFGHVWDYSLNPKTDVVDVLVSRLRAKVEKNFPTRLIRTVCGMVLRPGGRLILPTSLDKGALRRRAGSTKKNTRMQPALTD